MSGFDQNRVLAESVYPSTSGSNYYIKVKGFHFLDGSLPLATVALSDVEEQ